MDPRLPRLKKRSDFLKVAATRRKWVTPGVIVQIRSRRPKSENRTTSGNSEVGDGARIGFTVTKKVGNAVIRNRVKRRLRAASDQVFASHATDRHDFVLIGRKGTIERPFAALLKDMTFALKRLNAYDGEAGKDVAMTTNNGPTQLTGRETGGRET